MSDDEHDCPGIWTYEGRVTDELVPLGPMRLDGHCAGCGTAPRLTAELAALREEREKILRDYQIDGDLSLDDIVNRMVVNHLRHLKNHEAEVAALREVLRSIRDNPTPFGSELRLIAGKALGAETS